MHWHSKLMVERLGIDVHPTKQVTLCPFHPDSASNSLSIDLDKGVFFCHGGCDDPKGGGVVDFMIKWWWVKDQKRVTKSEARKSVRKLSSFAGHFQNAQELSREMMTQELRTFARRCGYRYAKLVHEHQRTIDRIHASCKREVPPPKDWRWLALDALYKELTWFTTAADICTTDSRTITPELVGVYRDAKARGFWDSFIEKERDALLAQDRAVTRRLDAATPKHVARTPVRQTASQSTCHVRPLRQPIPVRQPVK